jgi:hypothetical protein
MVTNRVVSQPGITLKTLKGILVSKEYDLRLMAVKEIHKLIKRVSYKDLPLQLISMLSKMDLSVLEAEKT